MNGQRYARSEHKPYYCDECSRVHVGTHTDLRALLGDRGERDSVAYAWCEREGVYHTASTRATLRIPSRGKVRCQWPKRYKSAMRKRYTRTGTYKDSQNPRVRALAG